MVVAQSSIQSIVRQQRDFFATGKTQDITFRLTQLNRLKDAIVEYQDQILAAVKSDLGRPEFEAYFEIATLMEIKVAIKQLKQWVKPQKIATSIDVFPAKAWIEPQPLGVVLIIGPWNYPFQLLMSPLVGAIAAGNCAILKPSEFAPATAKVVAQIIASIFDPNYVAVVEGDATVSQELLAEKFNHIFFTGGTAIGRKVMQAAAAQLTPVTLELGGKSPCIVEKTARLDYTAKRIAWGKLINSGQTCIAPDYLLVDRRIKDEFVAHLLQAVKSLYGDNPQTNPDYGRIVNQRQLARLVSLIDPAKVLLGGESNPDDRYLAPTILDRVTWDDPVMEAEIFGPILPILTYDDLDQAIAQINDRPHPLALYLFSQDEGIQRRVLQSTISGNVCLNDTVLQVSLPSLPFGGVGESGMGRYHGKASFETFSHFRSVLKRSMLLDLDFRYAPYTTGRLRQLKKIVTGK